MGLKMERTGIAKVESGRRPVSDIEIIAIAKVLKIPISSLFTDSEALFKQLEHK
jgi:transcriptional regulator with XRE-family HTH domain